MISSTEKLTTENMTITSHMSIIYGAMKKYPVLSIAIMLMGMATLFSCGIAISSFSTTANISADAQSKKSDSIVRELNQISTQIQAVSSNSNIKERQSALDSVEKNMASVLQSVRDVAKTSDIQNVSSQISGVKEDIDAQMGDIKKAVSESNGNKEYVEASSLPFSVISVDVVSSEPYVSVNYAEHITPLGVSDSLAGWRLVAADFDASIAEFVNEKNQYVKIILKGQ